MHIIILRLFLIAGASSTALVALAEPNRSATFMDYINDGACALAPKSVPQGLLSSSHQTCIKSYVHFYASNFEINCPSNTNCPALVSPNGFAIRPSRGHQLEIVRQMNVIDEVVEELSPMWLDQKHRDRLGITMAIDSHYLKKVLIAVGLTELRLRNSNFGEAFSEGMQDFLSRSPIGGRTLSGGGKVDMVVGEVGVGDGNPTVGVFQVSQALAYQLEDRYLKHTALATNEKSNIKDADKRLTERNDRIRFQLPTFKKNAAVAAANLLHLVSYAHAKGFDLAQQPGLLARYYNKGIGTLGIDVGSGEVRNFQWDSYAYYVESNWDVVKVLAE